QHIVRGFIYDVTQNPFKADIDKLKTDRSPTFGAAGAAVTVVAFSDFECPNCKEEAQAIRNNLEKTFPNQVRFYFKNYPLVEIHPWAKSAATAGRCIYRQDQAAFWKFHDWIYDQQSEVTPENFKTKMTDWAQANKLDSMQLGSCLETKAGEADIDKE